MIQFHFNWNHVSVIAGLTRTNFLFRLHEGSIKKEEIVEFLKALKAHLKQPLLVIWDALRAHRSRLVRGYLDDLGGHHPDRIPATVLARAESSGIPMGMVEAPCPGQLLPQQSWAVACHRTQQTQERPETHLDHHRLLDAGYPFVNVMIYRKLNSIFVLLRNSMSRGTCGGDHVGPPPDFALRRFCQDCQAAHQQRQGVH